ncbi:hypothetical protein CLI71_12275 [Prevotella intermedia]|uniref:Uncharacterized protein n=1 Tax=Prevotella intermedia TaxID=28131 RepID=A0A2A6EBW4_PREIN|nr:hypothetical protein CLI71_12275 [Prevotella intermedia]
MIFFIFLTSESVQASKKLFIILLLFLVQCKGMMPYESFVGILLEAKKFLLSLHTIKGTNSIRIVYTAECLTIL